MNKKTLKKSLLSLGLLCGMLGATSTNAFAAVTYESRSVWSGGKAAVTCKTYRNETYGVTMIRAKAEMNIKTGGIEYGPNAVKYSPYGYDWANGSFTTQNICQDGYTYHSYTIAGETGEYQVRVVTQ
jgi:hypothetical protein